MRDLSEPTPYGAVEANALAGLITELNIARRNNSSYPKGHPVIMTSLQKTLVLYTNLLEISQEILIAPTRNLLIFNGVALDKSNLVFRSFAKVLFECGIGLLQFLPGLTIEELNRFIVILSLKREEIQLHGGIEQLWAKSGLTSILIRPIRYDLLKTTEETSVSADPGTRKNFWERFANAFALSEINAGNNSFDPQLLAEAVNLYYSNNPSEFTAGKSLNALKEIMHNDTSLEDDTSLHKMVDFIERLTPELRSQLLSCSFESSSTALGPHSEKLLSALSSEVIISTLDDVNKNKTRLPPVLMGLLNKLGSQASPKNTHPNEADLDKDELGQRMKTLFREQTSEQFVPELYQAKLDRIMAADQIQIIQSEEIYELQDALNPKLIDNRIGEIILQLIMLDPTESDTKVLADNLASLCAYFLETGDYQQLIKTMHDSRDQRLPARFRAVIKDYFEQRSFIEELLNGLHTWGKSSFGQIKEMITQIGKPCCEPILDALAEESSMSLRRFMIDRLLEIGLPAGQAISARLSDSRWYYIRNLIVILRTMNDDSAVEAIKPLCHHADARVRLEAVKTLLHFRDPSIEHKILHDLDGSDHNLKLEAIRMAEKSCSPEITGRLLSILKRSGLSNSDYELKSAAVHSLGQLGQPEVLPEFGKILGSRNLLHPLLHTKLKLDIVRSLEHYPLSLARSILARLADGKDEIAVQAAESLNKLGANKP